MKIGLPKFTFGQKPPEPEQTPPNPLDQTAFGEIATQVCAGIRASEKRIKEFLVYIQDPKNAREMKDLWMNTHGDKASKWYDQAIKNLYNTYLPKQIVEHTWKHMGCEIESSSTGQKVFETIEGVRRIIAVYPASTPESEVKLRISEQKRIDQTVEQNRKIREIMQGKK